MAVGPGVAHIAWYVNTFRGDEFTTALKEFAPLARHYGATRWTVQRSTDDSYRLMHTVAFDDYHDWQLFWNGPEAQRFRAVHSGSYQLPLAYTWYEVVVDGRVGPADEPVAEEDVALEPEPAA